MHLKYLTLHGYKTFANKTEFLFDEGITAIVGPNGSGKSNVADAIRWALGAQSYTDLRVKKTEEMIFSGSASRARLGMAEVYLTLENLDSLSASTEPEVEGNGDERKRVDPVVELLRANPTEVTLGRRAYRDGQSEYFLNGARVRLRDIHELLARWGLARNTYAVVSQGLIDQALSLRPEERRVLFEEAAGIALYQSKRQNALEKLEETQQNLIRANDIINEIAPRLPALARQADRAKNYDSVVNSLDEKLRSWYAFQWARAQQTAQEASLREQSAREALNAHRAEIHGLSTRLTGLRRRGQELRAQLAEGRRSRAALESEHSTRARDLAVLEERVRFSEQRRDETLAEIDSMQQSKLTQEDRLALAVAELDEMQTERDELADRLREAESSLEQISAHGTPLTVHDSWIEQARNLIRRLALLKYELGDPARGLQLAQELSEEARLLGDFDVTPRNAGRASENWHARVTQLRTLLSTAELQLASARAASEGLRANLVQVDALMAARRNRVGEFQRELESLGQELRESQARYNESADALAQIDAEVSPADTELIKAEKSQVELEEREATLRNALAEFEDAHNRAVLDLERTNADIARLETEIEDDVGEGRVISQSMLRNSRLPTSGTTFTAGASDASEMSEGENVAPLEATLALDSNEPTQLRFLVADEFVALPVVSAIPEGLEKEVRKLRNQLKYMGAINANAPEEYAELKSRHTFLAEQATDARHAITSLHKAIAELDEIMKTRFEETFTAVNEEFGKFFTLLFNGGTARLELTQPDDLRQTGVDIIAKPPGKRAAHLAVLSGGERALTAAGLLFAILKVSPTPFCVMDEVDAMLDEANVSRFRDALRTLAEATQFIIITHNRTTMESADAVYGITMGEDGVSQAISLRLDQRGNGHGDVVEELRKAKSEKRKVKRRA